MRKYNISANLVRTIEQLYDKATSAVQINGSIGEWFRTTVGVTPDPGQETKAKMVWPCLKVFWYSKDNPTGHSERKKKKRQAEEEVGRQYQRVDRNGLCQLNAGS